jgi:hypothetical protein
MKLINKPVYKDFSGNIERKKKINKKEIDVFRDIDENTSFSVETTPEKNFELLNSEKGTLLYIKKDDLKVLDFIIDNIEKIEFFILGENVSYNFLSTFFDFMNNLIKQIPFAEKIPLYIVIRKEAIKPIQIENLRGKQEK